ncbi:MAG: VPLPA-CTERM sorting domain-containing protein [Gammaproteobacteria bacterium]|nr:VPLPA-CTERM sorting domain-containing protein [Gammaproteobacteria bacterium]
MFSKLISGAACTCLATASFNASAALIDITATSTDARFTDFTLSFDDISGDGLLQIDEVVQFSGFTLTNPANQAVNGLYDVIIGTPDVAGVSTSSGIPLFASSNWNFKRFPGDTALCCSRDFWSYSTEVQAVTAGQTIVPIPAAAWLFGSGLIGLAGLARTGLARRKA